MHIFEKAICAAETARRNQETVRAEEERRREEWQAFQYDLKMKNLVKILQRDFGIEAAMNEEGRIFVDGVEFAYREWGRSERLEIGYGRKWEMIRGRETGYGVFYAMESLGEALQTVRWTPHTRWERLLMWFGRKFPQRSFGAVLAG